MARIRIVDEWLPNPAAAMQKARTVMVVADSWSEQRVLMRAYAACADQTRPTIMLHGSELAIGPAGTDPHGPWGIHVAPLVDGRAQALRDALELAARRLAGSRGRPPRLADEMPAFETKVTNHWAPGVPRDLPPPAPAPSPMPQDLPPRPRAAPSAPRPEAAPSAPRPGAAPSARRQVTQKATPVSRAVKLSATRPGFVRPRPAPAKSVRAAHRHARETGPLFAIRRAGIPRKTPPGPHAVVRPRPTAPAALSVVVTRTMPHGFQLTEKERDVLNALGRASLMTAREIAHIASADDGIAWMEALMTKLADHGLDIIALGPDRAGEPTYEVRR